MNAFFAELGERFAAVARRQGAAIAPPELDPELAEELLALARAVAHGRERRFAPLATFLAGVSVERLRDARPDATDADVADIVRAVREALDREPPAGGSEGEVGEPAGPGG